MNGVVLRCRTCGTTQEHPGECDVCSAGPVAYFCSDHSPGIWLDGPVCQACGVRFGDAPAKPVGRSSSRSPSIPRSGTRPSRSGRPTTAPTHPATPGVSRIPGPAVPPLPSIVTDGDEGTDTPSLAELLVEMAEEGKRVRGTAAEAPSALRPAPRSGVPVIGCLFRLCCSCCSWACWPSW